VGEIRKVLFVGDHHVGSVHAVMPRDCITLEGNPIRANARQAWLQDKWDEMLKWIPVATGGDPFAVVFMGDHVEGVHHGTKEVWSPEPTDHAAMAERLLAPLADMAHKRYMLIGTECHTHNSELKLAFALGCEPDTHTGKSAWDELDLDVGDYGVVRCVHHIGATSREWTAYTGPASALHNMRAAAVDAGHPTPKALVAGHRHRHDYIETPGGGFAMTTPSWQFLTRHGRKVVTQSRTHIGAVLMDFTDPHRPQPWRFIRFGEANPGATL